MQRATRVGAVIVGAVGIAALIGWYAGVTALTTVHQGFSSMKPTTALAFVFLAVAAGTLGRGRLAVPLAGAAAVLGAGTLAEYGIGHSLGVDSLLPGIDFHGASLRMAPATALTLVLLGVAVVAGSYDRGAIMRALGWVAFGLSQVAVLGYIYDVSALYTVGSAAPMAPNTAVCLVALSLLILLHDPTAGLVGLLRDSGSAGRLLRPLVPSLLLGPLLLGWLRLRAQDQGWFDARSGVVALVMSMTVLGAAVSWRAAVRLRELDRQRDAAVDVLAETNRSLDATVQERTRRLTEAQRLGQLGGFECEFATDEWTYTEQMYDLWGVEPGGLSSEIIEALILEEDRPLADASWAKAMRVGGRHIQEFRIRRARDGTERVLRATLEVDLGPDNTALRVRGTHLDITDLTTAEKAAQRANAFFDAVLAATPDFTFVYDLATGAIVYVSRDQDILGIENEALKALEPEARTALVHPEDLPRLRAIDSAAADLADGQVLQLRYRGHHADGEWRWLSRRITPFRRDSSGAVVEVLGVVRDISDVMESEDRLTHAALHDSLTGLPNRALLIDRLEAALARSARDGREVAVLFCDLDGFKRVNDIAGHAAGDALLLEISGRFHDVLREYDTVARVGGDEFVIIVEPWNRADRGDRLDEADDAAAVAATPAFEADRALAVQVAERVAAVLQQPVRINGVDHVVSASIGITYATLGLGGRTGTVTAEQVLQDADTAMYLAKGRGKDRFEVFEHGQHTDLAERGRVEQLLRQALTWLTHPGQATVARTATFAAAYQPVFDSDTGTLVGFEALARLTDGDGLPVSPDVFIPIAEETGLIHPLGRAMLDLACGQLQTWRAELPGVEHVSMAVNISALQAQHASLGADVRSALNAHCLHPSDLVLELTETALLQVANSTLTSLRMLRAEGVGIAIDDFGIGYASLRYLATLPVSAVKVDRSFTAGLPHDETSRKIVKAVAGLAADMELTCIVEGVETIEQRDALPTGVYLQGFLLGRPQQPAALDVRALIGDDALARVRS
jgi:diguanylate cyclase (GGDEF)-like protein/PAS domain S-box-containing protein